MSRLARAVARALPVVPVLVVGIAAAASAQSVIPTQISGFLCANFRAIQTLAPLVALLVFGAALVFGLIRRHSNLVVDLIVGGLIALVIMNLPTIMANLGLQAGC